MLQYPGGGSRINFSVLENFTKKIEHRNDVICRKIIDSGNTNCLGTWTFSFRRTFFWTSFPGKFYKNNPLQ